MLGQKWLTKLLTVVSVSRAMVMAMAGVSSLDVRRSGIRSWVNFGMTFDGRNSNFPKTREEAIARVREYARRKGVHIPDGAEPSVSDVVAWGRSSGLTVLFEWSEAPDGSAVRSADGSELS